MAFTLYYHPLSSFCWKALIGLYETETAFTPRLVDLGNPEDVATFKKIWPLAKFPVLVDEGDNRTIPESSIIIEYLAQHSPGPAELTPRDPDLARQTRMRDRFYDLYVHQPMQKIVGDTLRPDDRTDPFGVAQARETLAVAYGMIERDIAGSTWAMGDIFTLADCAAFPALHYANLVAPLGAAHPNVGAYLDRLSKRASVARVLKEAEPYFAMFPGART